MEFFISRSGL